MTQIEIKFSHAEVETQRFRATLDDRSVAFGRYEDLKNTEPANIKHAAMSGVAMFKREAQATFSQGLQEEIALAPTAGGGWAREAGAGVLRRNAHAEFSKEALIAGMQELITDSGVCCELIELSAGLGRVWAWWTVRFPHSDPRASTRRAAAMAEAMWMSGG